MSTTTQDTPESTPELVRSLISEILSANPELTKILMEVFCENRERSE